MKRTTALFLVFLACGLPSQPDDRTQDARAEAVAARLEQRLRALRSLQADFEQTYRPAASTAPLTEKGRFIFQAPDRMRWEYTDPEPKVFVAKDGIFEQFYPEDNQLIRSRISGQDSGAEILSLLSGSKKLRDDYELDLDISESRTSRRIKLTPRSEGEYSQIILEVNSSTSLLDGAEFVDGAGNRTEFRFRKARPDTRLPRGVFDIKVPDGCEIIDDLPPAPPEKRSLDAGVL